MRAEAEGYKYTIRLPANLVLQESIAWLLKRPVGRPPHEVRRYHASFSYRAGSWSKPRRVVAKVERHPGELYPRVGFIVTDMTRPAERVVAFYNHRGTAEQHIKEGKNAVTWTRLSCRRFAANAVRLQLHALAYNLVNFLRTLALPEAVQQWSLTTLRDRRVDRRQDRAACEVDHLPDGRGAGATWLVPANPYRHRGAPSVAARAMLRGGGIGGRLVGQRETCVPMRAGRAGFSLRTRSRAQRRYRQRLPKGQHHCGTGRRAAIVRIRWPDGLVIWGMSVKLTRHGRSFSCAVAPARTGVLN
jgi:hypothetical protein